MIKPLVQKIKLRFKQKYNSRFPLLVLMYHDLADAEKDGLTVLTSDFRQQMKFLRELGYHFLSLKELEALHREQKPLPSKPVLITFDDGYLRSCQLLNSLITNDLPFLKVNMFLPIGYLGQINHWDQGSKAIISLDELSQIVGVKNNTDLNSPWTFGFHSYTHQNYRQLSVTEITEDISKCKSIQNAIAKSNPQIALTNTLAYPFGSFWKSKQDEFFAGLKKTGLSLAFRIGNRRNFWPLKNPLLIQRMDIRGDRDFIFFKNQIGEL